MCLSVLEGVFDEQKAVHGHTTHGGYTLKRAAMGLGNRVIGPQNWDILRFHQFLIRRDPAQARDAPEKWNVFCQLLDCRLGQNRLREDSPVLISRERDTAAVLATRPFRFAKANSSKGKPSCLRSIYPLAFIEQSMAIGTEDLKSHLITHLHAEYFDP